MSYASLKILKCSDSAPKNNSSTDTNQMCTQDVRQKYLSLIRNLMI